MKIGIIGAENSHSAAIAMTINIDGLVKGCSVDYIWGETPELAKAAAKQGQIPNIVAGTKDMLRKIDAVIVDHRHPKFHLAAAMPYVKAGMPIFIDKPFCNNSDKGREFLKLAKKSGSPVTSFGVVPLQASFNRFVKKMADVGTVVSGSVYGPCDIKSPYGGVFFYGIHQVEMALFAFGYDVKKVCVVRNKSNAIAHLMYADGKTVVLNFIKSGCNGFAMSVVGDKGNLHTDIKYDKHTYFSGIKMFVKMFKTTIEPIAHNKLLLPVKVLEALARSIKSNATEKV